MRIKSAKHHHNAAGIDARLNENLLLPIWKIAVVSVAKSGIRCKKIVSELCQKCAEIVPENWQCRRIQFISGKSKKNAPILAQKVLRGRDRSHLQMITPNFLHPYLTFSNLYAVKWY